MLWLLLLSSTLLPPWPVFPVLLIVVLMFTALMWKSFIRLYSRGQIALHEALSRVPETADLPALPPPLLADRTALETLTLTAESPAAGKLIRELQVRTRTGVTREPRAR